MNASESKMGTKRYRLKIATWTVVREVGQPSPRMLDSPEAVVELARDLLRDQDDDKEHFWVVLLNAKNHYLMAHLVSTGTQSATLVQPREVLGPALREGAAALILIHNHPLYGTRRRRGRICGSPGSWSTLPSLST